ncbi:Ferrous iron transport protein B [Proteiniphilum saccharofermentans]|uniref:Ferrous iron transport protein B n=1 Tax=Proteiniphilum saccharofermentans TaxID=1642647 RepID=A0A1R3TD83_9BACT|nr:ferrous iron transport protein B [Proteiniphilum saccharofermentans]SCD21965.1 Ferrous iron transport protein B [Proteiniphilum saccharofermentans]
MRLSELQTGQKAYIVKVNGSGAFRKRILEMGFIRGEEVKSILNAPLKDPIKYEIMEYEVSLRRSEAVMIEISMLAGDARNDALHKEEALLEEVFASETEENNNGTETRASLQRHDRPHPEKRIRVALLGNPNSGKTTIFNLASGAHEHVGNYSGVTVDSKEGTLRHNGYEFTLIDLPGTYSLSAYTPEELFVRKHILDEKPDVIVNVVSASAAERNLYLTTELIDLKVPIVIALNMYDELEESGRTFDYETFGSLINIPMVPTVGKRGEGIPQLLEKVIDIYKQEEFDYVQIPYGRVLEKSIGIMEREFKNVEPTLYAGWNMPLRYICVKLLEGDRDVEKRVRTLPQQEQIFSRRDKERIYIEKLLREDPESAFTNARYGFIAGGLKETLTEKTQFSEKTKLLDALVTHKYIGFPLFFLFLWVMFEATFRLGNYPMEWIEWLVEQLGNLVRGNMQEGPLKALVVDGIIGGVGGVIVFLPNIVILYLFIAFMEDSGYMARAAFIMDKLMHRIGLHGKSFIPLIMGFGCNVPAIMATRTIESRSSRMITMFIVPFMSCSARLPVYILFVSAFVPKYGGLVMLGLYAFGILIAALTARILRKTAFKEEETPFVMELPPYRMPTTKSIITHMWDRSSQYLRKMGGPILIASIVIWFLGYFPQNAERDAAFDSEIAMVDAQYDRSEISDEEREEKTTEIEHLRNTTHQENSYIGNIGKFIEPAMRPLGFDWKISVSLLSGMAAKEIVISTMGVLYTGDSEDQQSLQHRLKAESYADGSPIFTPLVVAGFLLFVLIYFPCVASVVAIKEESHSWGWALFSVLYSTGLAWFIAFLVYQIGNLLI